MSGRIRSGMTYNESQNEDERANVANACQIALDIELPMLLDSIDNAVEDKYVSALIRLFVINKAGKLTFNGAQGPFGFDLEKRDVAIRDVLSPAEQAAE